MIEEEAKMKVMAINSSSRKKWNTAMLLEHALEAATAKGAETELVHLYDLDYKGCTSCSACKLKGGNSYGKCAMKDGLTPLLEKLATADAFIIGSPVYFGTQQERCVHSWSDCFFNIWLIPGHQVRPLPGKFLPHSSTL